MNIPVLLGTGRTGNSSHFAADYVVSVLKESGHETELIDPRDYLKSPFTGRLGKEIKGTNNWQVAVKKANGLVVVTPEYNHAYPGELKLMFDMLYPEWKGLPIAVCGVSVGPWGGIRVVESFLPVLIGVEAIPIKKSVSFPGIQDLFDDKGVIKNNDFDKRVIGMIDSIKELSREV